MPPVLYVGGNSLVTGKTHFTSKIYPKIKCNHARLSYGLAQTCYVRIPPYHAEHTRPRQISQVKQHRARLVLGSETAWEPRVWYSFCSFAPWQHDDNMMSSCQLRRGVHGRRQSGCTALIDLLFRNERPPVTCSTSERGSYI